MNNITKATEEDKHVQKVIEVNDKKYRLTPKYMDWEKLFLDKNSKETYGNATQAALKAYNLDPIGQYEVARTMGSDNLTKHHNLMAKYYESKGKTASTLYDLYWEMMLARKDVNQLYAIAENMGLQLPMYKPVDKPQYVISQTTNNQVNVGGDIAISFIEEEVVDARDSEA